MNSLDVLVKLKELGIRVQVAGDGLEISGNEEYLTPGIIDELKNNKEQIIRFFKKNIQTRIPISSIEPMEQKDYYPLSSAQERLYVLQQLAQESTAYNLPMIMNLEGRVEEEKIEQILAKLVNRHESLRTSFEMIDEEPAQRVHPEVEFQLENSSVATHSSQDIIKNFIRPFDLSKAPLMRAGLIKTGERKHVLMVDMHHIITDGASDNILKKEFISLYSGKELPPLQFQYKDYSEWRRSRKIKEYLKRQEAYWLKEFAGEIPLLNLPIDYIRPAVQSFEGHTVHFKLIEEETSALKEMAAFSGATLFMVVLALYNVFLAKISNQEDIIVGTPIANRNYPGLTQIIGMFVNTIALRNFPIGEQKLIDFLSVVKKRTLEAFENQDYQFEDLVEKVALTRNMSRNPIFDTMFVFQNLITLPGGIAEQKIGEVHIKPYHHEIKSSKFDLTLNAAEVGDKLSLSFEYCTKLFKQETILRFVRYFKKMVSSGIDYPGKMIADIELVTREEKKIILYEFNDSETPYPKDKTIHRLFEEEVEKVGDRVAVIDIGHDHDIRGEGTHFTYRQLDEQSNRLANLFIEKGILADNIVGIMMERSVEMIIGILGILKAGGAYLPIDPDYPQERIDYILKDSNALAVIDKKFLGGPRGDFSKKPPGCRRPFYHSSHLAYIIYTSGSTGKPKGVLIDHRNVVRLMFNEKFPFDFNVNDIWTMFHSYCFDFSVWEMYGALLYGGKLLLISKMTARDTRRFLEILGKNQVTILNQTPTAFYNLSYLEVGNPREELNIRYIIFGGEPLTPSRLKEWRAKYPGVKLVNMYGITETTVHVTFKKLKDREVETAVSNIGQAIPTLSTYIMDRNFNLQPFCVAGELCIGGEGVGRGYLNKPELTAEKFVHNPYKVEERIYISGDLAKLREDGDIEYLGRIDSQVKIRGFRIELEEIEIRLLKHDNIKEAVVIERTDEKGDKHLAAYIVTGEPLDTNELRNFLANFLPDYMIPSYFIELEAIPLTLNGKIDKQALPIPVFETKEQYRAPRNEVEKKLTGVLEKVLGREKIGIDENFFMIGGDSIKAIQITTRMRSAGYKLEIKDLFQNPSIERLSPLVTPLKYQVEQCAVTGTIPLTPIQREFFEYNKIAPHHFNHAVMLNIKERIDKGTLGIIIEKIQEHHDALRMSYQIRGKEIVQTGNDVDYPNKIKEHDLRGEAGLKKSMESICNEIQAGINLEEGPLMKIGLFHLDDGDRVLIVIHHLVVDGVSWRILFEDIDTLYRQYKRSEKLKLPLKTSPFKEWSEMLKERSNSEAFLLEKPYWQALESENAEEIERDIKKSEGNYVRDADIVSFSISEEETDLLLGKVNEAFGTEINDILLTALGLGLKKTFAKDKYVTALEGHGREELFENVDISRTVGWFTSVYPVLLDISHADDPGRQIKEIKENLRKIPHKGIGYGILKYLTSAGNKGNIQFKLRPSASFNYLGQFGTDVRNLSFEIANEPVGNTMSLAAQRNYEFDITGMVADKQLRMDITYNRNHYERGTIKKLMGNLKKELRRLIEYCSRKERREFTPSDFTYKGLPIGVVDELCNRFAVEDIYTLSPMQEGMLFHALIDEHSSSYFEQTSYRLRMELDIDVFKRSLNKLLSRHDILRTVFVFKGVDRLIQVVLKQREIDFYYENIGHIEGEDAKKIFIKEFKTRDRRKGFNLNHDALMRVSVLKVGNGEYEVIWSFHHILMDGWCIGILNKEFFEIYNGMIEGRKVELPAIRPYRDYIRWLEQRDRDTARMYWKEYLAYYEENSGVPRLLSSKNKGTDYRDEHLELLLEIEETDRLKRIGERRGVTLNVIMQVIWGILLGRYNGKEDVVFGSVVSGRPPEIEGIESMVGLFINTVPVRVRYGGDMEFGDLLEKFQQSSLNCEPHHYYPLADIQAESSLKQNLIDHIYIFENYPISEQFEAFEVLGTGGRKNGAAPGFRVSNVDVWEQTNYDFNVVLGAADRLMIRFDYNGNIFEREFITKIGTYIIQIVRQVIENEDKKINEIEIMMDEEKQQILYGFNDTRVDYPIDKTIHQLFEEQASRTPDYISLVGADLRVSPVSLSYRELNEQSGGVAGLLIEKGVLADTIVGIMTERSVEMIIGIMGILKSGGAYLPIDPDYPQERIDYILKDSGAKFLINEMFFRGSRGAILQKSSPCDVNLAYIIYTSGSTGKPKGVVIEHRSVINFIKGITDIIPFTVNDRILSLTTISFDIFGLETLVPLVSGSVVAMGGREEQLNPEAAGIAIERENISIFQVTPSRLHTIISLPVAAVSLKILKFLLVGGEAFPGPMLEKVRTLIHGKIFNMYGPTETTIWSTVRDVSGGVAETLNIGKPIANTVIYILGGSLHMIPIGAPGELYIGGDGLSRGYLNRPELTAERFDRDGGKNEKFLGVRTGGLFFKKAPGRRRLYKTGDLARWLPDGNIEFLGRIDHQVKLRGFRIELGEIENRLAHYPGIREAVVTAKTDKNGDKYLSAYIVSCQEFLVSELKGYLLKHLPDYMIPSYFSLIEKIPFTPNGKIDRKALNSIDTVMDANVEYAAPTNEIEETIVNIWKETLRLDKVGIYDNFFDLGGNSLQIITINNKIGRALEKDIPAVKMLSYPTIHSLAEYLNQGKINDPISNEKIKESVSNWEETMQMLIGNENDDK
ncbi:MAG: Non-ribosomal peptide synthetase [Acidobacteriota bacterium]|nr:Non-ribosomal peptide synthetase [Acidobacteriota bacterium]